METALWGRQRPEDVDLAKIGGSKLVVGHSITDRATILRYPVAKPKESSV